MYPYGLKNNPYHSGPTPRLTDSVILGGRRHKEAKSTILSCIEDVHSKMRSSEKDLRMVTVIQDVGSGKTHLALHLRSLEEVYAKSVISYVDFSQIYPRNENAILCSILEGFRQEDMEALRRRLINLVLASSLHDRKKSKQVKRIFNHGFFSEFMGGSIDDKIKLLLQKRFAISDFATLSEILEDKFTEYERELIFYIINGELTEKARSVSSLGDTMKLLSLIIKLHHQLLNKVTIFEFDEFDTESISMEFIKGIINYILPSSIVLLILTPASYNELRKKNIPLYDRLEKANHKVDLAGSNTYSEINDIVLEYIRNNNTEGRFTAELETDLSRKIKMIYDEFPDFRNVRSMINILYHAMELARNRAVEIIDEQVLDETIRTTFPWLKIKDSMMEVPVSEFMKIRKITDNVKTLEDNVRYAVRDLVQYTGNEIVKKIPLTSDDVSQGADDDLVDVVYYDSEGDKIAVSVALDRERTNKIDHSAEMTVLSRNLKQLLILTDVINRSGVFEGNGTNVRKVRVDRSKLIDLIYFSSKFRQSQISDEDFQRASMLAKSIELP